MSNRKQNTESKMNLAVNEAIGQATILARQRMAALLGGSGGHALDTKRPQIWCEFGFPATIGLADFINLYSRGGVAHGAVNKYVNNCWRTSPEIIEGEESDDAKDATPWEASVKKVIKPRTWAAFKEADRRRMVGRYSGILLQIRDNGRWEDPVIRKGSVVQKFLPVWAGAIKPIEFDNDPNSMNYGKPTMWQLTEQPVASSGQAAVGRQIKVHPDRLFILGDYTDGAIGFLEPVYNNFVSLEKVEGGSGESFLKNAARQIALSFDKDVNLGSIAQTYGVSLPELKQRFQETARELNRGNDTMLITQGATPTSLVDAVSDPEPTYNVNIMSISCGIEMPSKILIGNQTGERASTEDQKSFNNTCNARRVDLGFDIEDFVRHLQRIYVLQPMGEFAVIWDDLNEMTPSERLASAKVMSEINAGSMGTGEQVFEVKEIRVAAGYEPTDKIPLPDQLDEEDEETTNTPPSNTQ